MLAGMSSRELTEWQLYDLMEGLPDKRDDLRAGTIASIVANTRMGKKSKALKPEDFFPSLRPPTVPTDPAERMKAKFMSALVGAGVELPPEVARDHDRKPDSDAGA